jgi:hypothetical protein
VSKVSAKFDSNMERISEKDREVENRFNEVQNNLLEELRIKIEQVGRDL